MTAQFYQLTLDRAIAKYEAGLMSSVGLLYDYFCIRFKPGWRINIDPEQVCQQLKLTKDQFYRGLRKIKQVFPQFKIDIIRTATRLDGFIEETAATDGENTTATEKTPTSDGESTTHYEKSATCYEETANRERQTTSKHSQSSDSPNSFSDTNQIKKDSLSQKQPPQKKKPTKEAYADFWSSLPTEEREKFLNFVREKTKHFPNPIASIHDYLSSNARWQEFYQNFRVVAQVEEDKLRDWTQHPDWQVALEAMRVGVPRFMGLGDLGCSHLPREVRVAMAEYAKKHNLIWGEE